MFYRQTLYIHSININLAEGAHLSVTLEVARGDWITPIRFYEQIHYKLENKNH